MWGRKTKEPREGGVMLRVALRTIKKNVSKRAARRGE